MTTARKIINSAGRLIHVVGRGQTMPAYEAQNALEALNGLLEEFSVEGGMTFTSVQETFNLTGAESYTIGSGGTFNTERPIEIESAFITQSGSDYTLSQISASSYGNIEDKSAAGVGDYFYYDNNAPLSKIYLWPVPDASYTLTIYSKKLLTAFADLTTDYTLSPAFERMLIKNLAVTLAPEYEKEASPTVQRDARKSRNAILVYNQRNNYQTTSVDEALTTTGGFNIYSGDLN